MTHLRENVTEPDDLSPGDVIYAYEDGTIVLDDGITTHNAVRARRWLEDQESRKHGK